MLYVALGKALSVSGSQRIREAEEGGSKERRVRGERRKTFLSWVRPRTLKKIKEREKGGDRQRE